MTMRRVILALSPAAGALFGTVLALSLAGCGETRPTDPADRISDAQLGIIVSDHLASFGTGGVE